MLKILNKIQYLPKKLKLLSECCGSSIILSDIDRKSVVRERV